MATSIRAVNILCVSSWVAHTYLPVHVQMEHYLQDLICDYNYMPVKVGENVLHRCSIPATQLQIVIEQTCSSQCAGW